MKKLNLFFVTAFVMGVSGITLSLGSEVDDPVKNVKLAPRNSLEYLLNDDMRACGGKTPLETKYVPGEYQGLVELNLSELPYFEEVDFNLLNQMTRKYRVLVKDSRGPLAQITRDVIPTEEQFARASLGNLSATSLYYYADRGVYWHFYRNVSEKAVWIRDMARTEVDIEFGNFGNRCDSNYNGKVSMGISERLWTEVKSRKDFDLVSGRPVKETKNFSSNYDFSNLYENDHTYVRFSQVVGDRLFAAIKAKLGTTLYCCPRVSASNSGPGSN